MHRPNTPFPRMWRCIYAAELLLIITPATWATPPALTVSPATETTITIHTEEILREKLPDTVFGFNIRWSGFQADLWEPKESRTHPAVTQALKSFPQAMYRYPGGTVANSFDWETSHQPAEVRRAINSQQSSGAPVPLFGIDEYLAFVTEIEGSPFYTLNLLGREVRGNPVEVSSNQMAESNRRLARYLKERLAPLSLPRIYQLGNELDRGTTEWSHEKYIARARDTIHAMQEADPGARFVAFVREFDWRYRLPGRTGISRHDTLIRDVLRGLPEVNDLSLNIYYDGRLRENGKFLAVSEALTKLAQAIDVARSIRSDRAPAFWVTEHARRISIEEDDLRQRDRYLVNNLAGALSSADFLIGLSQIAEVQGAAWHALNGIDRRLFNPGTEPTPTAVYWAYRVLRASPSWAVARTYTASTNFSLYPGGYDVRAAGFASGDHKSLAVWAINRANRAAPATLQVPGWGNRQVQLRHFCVAGTPGSAADQPDSTYQHQLDPSLETTRFNASGSLLITLPATSISNFVITHFAQTSPGS